jgi:hypothetical protein
LGFVEPSIVLGSSMIYEEGEDSDDSFERLLDLSLSNLPGGGIKDSSVIDIEDLRLELKVRLLLCILLLVYNNFIDVGTSTSIPYEFR